MYFKEEDKIFKQGERKGEKWEKIGKNGAEISKEQHKVFLLKKRALQAIIHSQTKTREEHHEKKMISKIMAAALIGTMCAGMAVPVIGADDEKK